jgi:hypothetical protein
MIVRAHQVAASNLDAFWGDWEENAVDFGTQGWYTRRHRAFKKCLILLDFCEQGGNPSLSASHEQCAEIQSNQAFLDPPVSARCRRFELSNGPNSSPSCATLTGAMSQGWPSSYRGYAPSRPDHRQSGLDRRQANQAANDRGHDDAAKHSPPAKFAS